MRTSRGGAPVSCAPSALGEALGEEGARAEVAPRPEGPFEALARARDGTTLDALATAFESPSLRAFGRVRVAVLVACLVPLLMMLELDRELVASGHAAPLRLLGDSLLAAYVVFELTRRTPRMTGAAGAAMLSLAVRWLGMAAALCGRDVHVAVWGAALLSAAAGVAVLTRRPSRERVLLELLAKVGVTPSDAIAARRPDDASGALVFAALAAAAGLPLLVFGLHRANAGLAVTAFAFVAFAAVVPELVRRAWDRDRPLEVPVRARVAFGLAVGLVLATAFVHGAHAFFDAGADLARCTGRLERGARELLAREAAEVARGLSNVRASWALASLTVVAVPFAEERIFRGLLMNALARKYGAAYGLFASAVVFGLAHAGIYEVALYQTVLLGLAFGVAYAEGGLLASTLAHATWNLLLLL